MSAVRLCALIPTYDNPRTVRATVAAVGRQLPDVLLVDDGSGAEGREACAALAAEGLATLVRRPRNGGKGAAVKTGFSAAAERGFTHVFQIDADGQHDLECIPAFVEAARQQPHALVAGYPVYAGSPPRSRLVARGITRFWVAVETGARERIRDAMIGFRVYPLAAALATRTRGDHMDFDIEIAVRMARAGAPVVNLPVGVRYLSAAEGGVSHFKMFADNLRFFGMHSRLCTSGALGWARRALLGRRP